MKALFTMGAMLLCLNSYAQSYELAQIGKHEPEVLQSMSNDPGFSFKGLTKEEEDNYHISFVSKTENQACNLFFNGDVCYAVSFYYPIKNLPEVIGSLNAVYKRTDDKIWVDQTLTYKIKIVVEDVFVQVAFKKM